MRRLLLVPLLLLAGCGDQPDRVATAEVRHTGSGTVLQGREGGPELCFSVQDSYPPQCGGVPLLGWDWAAADGEERANGTTWGEYRVTGRYDGTSLTVTGPPEAPERPPRDEDPVDTPCPAPDGGWRAEDPGRTDEDALQAAIGAARAQGDHAGAWIDDEDGQRVLTLAFTGDLDRHRAETGERWGGPLCLVQHARTLAELERVSEEVYEAAPELGLQVTSGWTDETGNTVHLGVVAVSEEQQRALDERYGKGVVVVEPALREVR